MDAADYRPFKEAVEKSIRARAGTDLRESVGASTVAWLGRADQCFSGVVHWFLFNHVFRMRAAFRVVPE
jgi:hypothetical protein